MIPPRQLNSLERQSAAIVLVLVGGGGPLQG